MTLGQPLKIVLINFGIIFFCFYYAWKTFFCVPDMFIYLMAINEHNNRYAENILCRITLQQRWLPPHVDICCVRDHCINL